MRTVCKFMWVLTVPRKETIMKATTGTAKRSFRNVPRVIATGSIAVLAIASTAIVTGFVRELKTKTAMNTNSIMADLEVVEIAEATTTVPQKETLVLLVTDHQLNNVERIDIGDRSPMFLDAQTSTAFTTTTSCTTTTTDWFMTTETTTTTYTSPISVTLQQVDTQPWGNKIGSKYQVSKSDFVELCNLLGREYGADFVPVEEKALVVQTVLNRVSDPRFPDTVEAVIAQPGQYTGYLDRGFYSEETVTESVRQAVLYALNGNVDNNYVFYWGDGMKNHFYTYEEYDKFATDLNAFKANQ